MNKKEIFNKVAVIIAELNEQYEYLAQNPENLNELELELFAANADFLSDHISILQKLNENSKTQNSELSASDTRQTETLNIVFEQEVQESPQFEEGPEVTISEWKFELEDDPVDSFDYEEKSADELFDRPLTEEEMQVIDQKTRLKVLPEEEFEIKIEEFIESEPAEEEVVIEQADPELLIFEESIMEIHEPEPEKTTSEISQPLTINEILSAQSSRSTVSSQFVQRQVKDLKSLISMNDKLLFVRDLFNGYSLAYSEAVELLNRFDNIEAADNFLRQNYAAKNNWSEKQNVVDKFYEILSKRFSK
ncbi:MAG: hypothetical protein WC220_14935 [Pedobacter sp.]|jgi:RecG-like helicase